MPDEYKKFVYAGHAGATGDAIKMVEGLDADLINMDLVNTQPNSMILPSGLGQYCNPGVAGAYKAGAYMVNQNGERFFNESANAWDLMQAMKQNEAQYLIMDQTAFDNFNAGMTNSKIYTMEDVEKWLSDDYDGQPVMKQGRDAGRALREAESSGGRGGSLREGIQRLCGGSDRGCVRTHACRGAERRRFVLRASDAHPLLCVPRRSAYQRQHAGAEHKAGSHSGSVRGGRSRRQVWRATFTWAQRCLDGQSLPVMMRRTR